MFYRIPTIKKRIKEAYKAASLLVGLTQEGWLYVGGTAWLIVQDIKNTPKEFKAAIIELAGELPEPGEVYRAGKDGNQMEMEHLDLYLLPRKHQAINETGEDYDMTNVIFRWGDKDIRFLKSISGKNAAIVSDALAGVPDPEAIDQGKGETEITGPTRPMGESCFVWHNDDTWYAAWPITVPEEGNPHREDLDQVSKGFGCGSILGAEKLA